ncbi:MAG: hypothetical protein HQL91_10050 [Magnetococcales bacterium]|nr:hypothetical protein [Magnetococcales bacterium]
MAARKQRPSQKMTPGGRSGVGDAQHVRLYHWILKSEAWQSLSGNACKLLLLVWKRHNGENNGEISFSNREAAQLVPCGKNQAGGLFRELMEKGFLKVAEKGSFDFKTHHATTWILTAERLKDNPPTKDFMSWKNPKNQKSVPSGGIYSPPGRDCDPLPVPAGGTDDPLARDRDPDF